MFGSSFPNPNPGGFQQQGQQQQPQQNDSSVPFGGFGSAPPTTMSAFGTSSNTLPAQSSAMNMQMNSNPSHGHNGGFGSTSNAGGSGFGSSSTSTFGSPFGQPSQGGGSGFGASNTTTTSQMNANVTNTAAPSPFGTSNTVMNSGNNMNMGMGMGMGMGATNPPVPTMQSPFGNSNNTISNTSHQDPFSASTSSNTMTNVNSAANAEMNTSGFGSSNSISGGTTSTFGTSSNTFTSPFVGSSTNTSGFGSNTNIITNTNTATSTNDKESNSNLEWVNPNSNKNRESAAGHTEPAISLAEDKKYELAKLKARLEEKKKKMMEMKLKAQSQSQSKSQTKSLSQAQPLGQTKTQVDNTPRSLPKGGSSMNMLSRARPLGQGQTDNPSESQPKGRHAKVEKKKVTKKKNNDAGADAGGNVSLAAKNEKRFAQNSTANRPTLAMLPQDLQQRARDYHPSQDADNNEDESEGVGNGATSTGGNLIGTCHHMCPDEELVRRENESGVQMLELICKQIHPKGWTLRDTAVKRFRRSAADFKLDIPSLVRPPDVLERVCGYLEEWIVERDRQGPDPRFGNTPPPLDVYQFVWDRTRMIRKDFILQNYIGTGGKCNAIAVRCHERIARWHTMCEHQLSHIPDFVVMQSQQNIQELGATMKSLNMYYDDAEGRSVVDDATDAGNAKNIDMYHGCHSATVKGTNPVDYDGKPLMNSADTAMLSKRIIGNPNAGSGTAEPEMRGLYILLTINNDGGMEVLKYAARLSRDRPNIFNSKPVQLALQVYKARRDYNYARFFSLLRSKSTPYLYGCVMFKYVETMRRAAFRIMSKTFGTKRKDSGEGINDQYPLRDLVHLLGFEDLNEAKNACAHYNIAVKEMPLGNGSADHIDIIFWRTGTGFKEQRDPQKGTVLSLKPRKMNRIIESKLNGATRVAICRGEVSGVDAILLQGTVSPETSKIVEERAKRQELIKIEQLRALEEAKRREAERMESFRKQQAYERRERAIKSASQKEAQKREVDLKRKLEKERERLKHENELRIRREQELKLEQEKAAMLKQQQEKEAQRLRVEQKEAARLKAEKEEAQRIRFKQQEADRLRRQEEEEAEKRRKLIEQQRQDELERQRREREAIEKQRQEALAKKRAEEEAERERVELEWQSRIAYARKFVAMKVWSSRLSTIRDRRERTKASIESFDPLSSVNYSSMRERMIFREKPEYHNIQEYQQHHECSNLSSSQLINGCETQRLNELSYSSTIESFDPFSTFCHDSTEEAMAPPKIDYEAEQQHNPVMESCPSIVSEHENMHTILEKRDENKKIDVNECQEIDNHDIAPTKLPFTKKRHVDITIDGKIEIKRSKLSVSMPSVDLQHSQNFTNNLRNLEEDAGLGRILGDPVFAKLIKSDKHLQQLMDNL